MAVIFEDEGNPKQRYQRPAKQPAMVSLLLRFGVVKTERQATLVLVGLIILASTVTFIVLRKDGYGNEYSSSKYDIGDTKEAYYGSIK